VGKRVVQIITAKDKRQKHEPEPNRRQEKRIKVRNEIKASKFSRGHNCHFPILKFKVHISLSHSLSPNWKRLQATCGLPVYIFLFFDLSSIIIYQLFSFCGIPTPPQNPVFLPPLLSLPPSFCLYTCNVFFFFF
jgi:hypothetical protein